MKLTANLVSRERAIELAPVYVAYSDGDFGKFDGMLAQFETLKRGDAAITSNFGEFVKVRVTSVRHDSVHAVDGPVVRVSNGEYSWRVDGNSYAAPIPKGVS